MRCVHELIAAPLMFRAGIVLHCLSHDAAFGVEHDEAGAYFGREMEKVELCPEPAMVATLRFLHAGEVFVESGLGLPSGPVNALQLLAALVAPPVSRCNLGQFEITKLLCGRDVRAAAEVDELVVRASRRRAAPAARTLR